MSSYLYQNRFMKEKDENLITVDELLEISKIKQKKLSGYIKNKLLSYEREDNSGNRYFDKDKVLGRLKEIERLEKNGYTVEEIKSYFVRESAPIMVIEEANSKEELGFNHHKKYRKNSNGKWKEIER